jgi:peptidoglycan biosynthesis protein MviN/MurJ (putative lipid II flippase)
VSRPDGNYPPAVARSGRTASNAAIASISQATTMISGGLLALIVAATIGTNASTDGFFAAFAVYATVVSFAQSSRTTIVARMLEGRTRFEMFDRYLGAGGLIFIPVAIAFVPLGEPIAGLVTGGLPDAARDTAATALLLFAPAAGLQIFAALGAAMLGAREDFLWAGVAFVAGSAVAIVGFVALQPSLAVDGLAVAVLLGSVVSAAVVATGLARDGWRPSRTTVTEPRAAVRAAGVLMISSVSFLIAQAGYIITLGVAARLGVGVITVYTYAFLAMNLVQAVFASSVSMVMAAPLAQTWDLRSATLLPHHEAVLRAGMLLVVPVLAAAALVGTDVAGVVLGEFTASEARLTVELFLILAVNVIWGLVNAVPYAALVGVGRYVALASITGAVVLVQVLLALLAGAWDDIWLLAASVPISSAGSVVAMLLVVSRGYAALAGPRLVAIVALFAATGALAFVTPWALAVALGLPAAGWIALAIGLVAYALIVTLLPAEREIAVRLLTSVVHPRLPAAVDR